jgi:hypothetical protein
MHFHLPKALHGWREFAGEVGIIVLGVLIALAFEQLVETLHWQAQARLAQGELAKDLALASDLASERVAVTRCIDDRLTLIKSALVSSGDRWTATLPATTDGYEFTGGVYSAPWRIWNTQQWDSLVADGTVPHLAAERQRNYALLYHNVRLLADLNQEELKTAPKLQILAEKNIPLSADTKAQLIETVAQLREYNAAITVMSRQMLRRVKDAGALPPMANTEQRLSDSSSEAMKCNSAREQLRSRVAKEWFTLHR